MACYVVSGGQRRRRRRVRYEARAEMGQLLPAWAITIHKATAGVQRAGVQRIALTLVELQQMLALLSAINVREKKYCFVRMQRFVDQKSGKWPGAFWAP
jgi:hypothetical protein